MFQFPTFASHYGMTGLQPAGLPHSEIWGSKIICISPQLIAAYHVLHRLREPRHPPSALAYFLISGYHRGKSDWYIFSLLLLLYFTLSIMSKIFLLLRFLCVRNFLWRITDSNRWPSACKADALASWANPPGIMCQYANSIMCQFHSCHWQFGKLSHWEIISVVPGRVELPTSTLSV